MSNSLHFHASDEYQQIASKDNDFMIISDKKEFFTAAFTSLAATAGITNPTDIAFLTSVAEIRLTASADSTSSVELFIQGLVATDPPRRIVFALLPSKFGRHNTPSRSHSVAALVKSHKGSKKDLTIILAPSLGAYHIPQALAAARQFPLFSLQSSINKDKKNTIHIVLYGHKENSTKETLTALANVSEGIQLAQELVDSPPNVLNCDEYLAQCTVIAASLHCTIKVIQGKDLNEQGFGGIYGVGKASEQQPCFVVLSHISPGFEKEKSICMVGKGIMYDTGGLSIKTPTTSMAGMKTDMGGSAAVLGAFQAAVKSENAVGPLSVRPDDVLTMLSGKTVEVKQSIQTSAIICVNRVNNTDAEGRLVLSDGCFYAAERLQPKVIIDIATLTGGQLVATGRKHAAIYCNDEELENICVATGKATGDLVHPIPYCPEFYKPEYKSEIADMKNSVADRMNAQASCAAQFIGNNIENYLTEGGKWLHIDMAGPACVGERATGYGVALLYDLLVTLSQK